MSELVSKLALVGDDCESCKAFWIGRQKKKARKLVDLGVKTDAGHAIIVCPYCDGQPLLTRNGQ